MFHFCDLENNYRVKTTVRVKQHNIITRMKEKKSV